MINKEMATEIFDKNSCLVENRNVIPEDIAVKIAGENAVEFSKKYKKDSYNGYGIGDYTMNYLTEKGFLLAITYMNISEHRSTKEVK